MQKLLVTYLSPFQSELLFWLQVAVSACVPGVTLDLSTLDIDEDIDGEGSYIELSTVAFQLCTDGTWRSIWRYVDQDGDGDDFIANGEVLIEGERNAAALVSRTVAAMATYILSMEFEYQSERRYDELEVYQPCRKLSPQYCGGFCGCWRCRHAKGATAKHIADCYLCRTNNVREEFPEDYTPPF